MAFLRLNPVVPTGPINYLLGLTSVRLLPYAAATLAFLTPPSLLVAWSFPAKFIIWRSAA